MKAASSIRCYVLSNGDSAEPPELERNTSPGFTMSISRGAIEHLISHQELSGVINLSSPFPVPNRDFMCCLRHSWCTSYVGLPAPKWILALGAVLLRTETELVLKSRRVVPRRLLESGFEFHFPNWRGACQDLVHRWRELHCEGPAS